MALLDPLLRKARDGDHDAIMEIMRTFTPLMKKHSRINGVYSEDCMQEILICVLLAIRRFPLD